ncbi:Ltp family lipoprotein [Micromonospora sp. DT81.3]|uniref:Ltp family lipoprotein n=1 Tax=Micromonospora sp. DT81.3 TaxID=3416523 RepID=UPI003CEDBFCF
MSSSSTALEVSSGIAPTGAVAGVSTGMAASSASTPVYRFYSPTFQGHFYTADPVERDTIIRQWSSDWTYEGERYSAFTTQVAGTVPLYRFWSDQLRGHFYTADQGERDHVMRTWAATWSYEGVAYYVYPAGSGAPNTVAVSRFWGPGVQHHFYTADATERDTVISRWPNVWSFEGERFRVPLPGNPVEPSVLTQTQQNAVALAKEYLKYLSFSRLGLIEQLGYEGFSTADATVGVDHAGADWRSEAVEGASLYLDEWSFSRSGLIEQLEFESFSTADATYGVDHAGADWNAEAAEGAAWYMQSSNYTRDALRAALVRDGFTPSQVEFGLDSVGY